MIKQLLTATLAALAFSAWAGPIVFFDTRYDVSTVAITPDGAPGLDVQTSSGATVPLVSQATSLGSTDVALAGAIAAAGLLSTSADAGASGAGVSSAVATAGFSGWFTNDGPVTLDIDFQGFDDVTDSGLSETLLFVSLVSDGVTLFSDYVTGRTQLYYNPLAGTLSHLELLLSSSVSAGFPQGVGGASGTGLVSFSGTVPLGASWTFVLIGLGALLLARRRVPAPAPH